VVGQPGSAIAGGVLTKWTYDCANALGLLCTVTYDGTGGSGNFTSKATTYDRYSRPVGTTTRIDGKDFSSQIAYDALGRPRYAVYPQATSSAAPLAIETRYNAAGYADQTRHAVTGFIYQTITARNSDGQLNQASLAGTLLTQGNSYGSDGLARIAQISVTGGATLSQGSALTASAISRAAVWAVREQRAKTSATTRWIDSLAALAVAVWSTTSAAMVMTAPAISPARPPSAWGIP